MVELGLTNSLNSAVMPTETGCSAVHRDSSGVLRTSTPYHFHLARRAAMERQEGRMSSTFRYVMPLDDSGVTGTEVDLKRISKHQRQQLVDRGARKSMSSSHSPFHYSCTIQESHACA